MTAASGAEGLLRAVGIYTNGLKGNDSRHCCDSSTFGDTVLIHSADRRRKLVPGTRRVLGAFVVAWLGLALQPCAMAAAEHDACPGCPPGMEHGGAFQHSAADASDAAVPCAVDLIDCMRGDVYSHDGRGAQSAPAKPAGGGSGDGPATGSGHAVAALLDTAHGPPAITRSPPPGTVPGRGIAPGSPPPRNLLFCVYLK